MIQNIWLGGAGGFSKYPDMHEVMTALGLTGVNGLTHKNTVGHQNHFHIDVRPPELLKIDDGSKLLTAVDGINADLLGNNTPLTTLLRDAIYEQTQGKEAEMVMMLDMPTTIIVAQAQTAQQVKNFTIGVCEIYPRLEE